MEWNITYSPPDPLPMQSARSCTQDSFKGNYFQFSEVRKIPGSSLNDSVTKWNLLLQLQNWKMRLDCSIVDMPKTKLRQRLLALESDATTDASVNTSCFSTIWTTRLPNLTYLPFPSNHCLLMFQLHYPEKMRPVNGRHQNYVSWYDHSDILQLLSTTYLVFLPWNLGKFLSSSS